MRCGDAEDLRWCPDAVPFLPCLICRIREEGSRSRPQRKQSMRLCAISETLMTMNISPSLANGGLLLVRELRRSEVEDRKGLATGGC